MSKPTVFASAVERRMQERYADLDEVIQMAADGELRQLWQVTEDQRSTGGATSSTLCCVRALARP